ncbi:hypothetical protein CRYUN_Cryun27aG0065900 [Craigia yunnanensis]
MEFGYWENEVWKWQINLRRNVLAWENSQWNEFWSTISEMFLNRNDTDKILWKPSCNGLYSTKSFLLGAPTKLSPKSGDYLLACSSRQSSG